jgi:hypothetical protein
MGYKRKMKQLPGCKTAQVAAIVEKTMTPSEAEIITDKGRCIIRTHCQAS